jgi:hypothetical protein
MKVIDQTFPFLISTTKNHPGVKEKILKSISSMGTSSVDNPANHEKISNTDWYLGRDVPRPYFDDIEQILTEHISLVNEVLGHPEGNKPSLVNYWFQQYEYSDYHRWHMHASCLFSNVYYVELPEESSKTSFKIMNREFTVDVKEGDILTFPSCILHQSAPNQSHHRKTVISFNLN